LLKQYLLSPGPTAVPERVLLRMAHPMIHHRTPRFSAIFAETKGMLEQIIQTGNDALILASSGSGAMEAAVTSSRDQRRICAGQRDQYDDRTSNS